MSSNTNVQEPAISDSQRLHNKYVYPEFADFDGEQLLRWVLRKILPMALFRTWEILAGHQAQGNDCFLSIRRLAEEAEVGERTIRLDLHELSARKLMTLRPERKLLRQADGTLKLRLVVCKDFAGLYALAHEYLAWTASEAYIAPEREHAELIRSDEALVRKLLRFNNYRRVLLNKIPGPKPQPREEHLWFAEYEAEDAPADTTGTIRKEDLNEDLQKDLKDDSKERIITSNHTDSLERDSFDSGVPQKDGGGAHGYTKEPNQAQLTPVPEETKHATAEETRAKLIERARTAPERAVRPPVRHELVASFVREVAPVFCDQNLKGSLTRAQRCVEGTRLSQKDILACLVKAYLVTQETRHVRPQYRRPEGDIKMPLFTTMLDRFVEQCASGGFHYDNEHLAADIASDDRLVLFVVEHNLEAMLLGEDSGKPEEPIVLTEVSVEKPQPEAQNGESEHGHTQPSRRSQRFIQVEDPALGWVTYEHANWLGRRLREQLGEASYDFACFPTQHGRYVVVLYERGGDIEQGWLFGTTDEVQEYL